MTLAVNIAQGGSNNVTMRNRIINGSMMIDQRNAGASVTPTADSYSLDRWNVNTSQASKFSVQQNAGSVTPPVGFSNYLGITVGASANVTVGAGDYFFLRQYIEGFNFADMGFGTANASSVTLSFKVYSSLTGTFGGVLKNSGASRSYPFTYTVSSANTWTSVSVTIAGDTSGTWVGATNGVGAAVLFSIGAGSTYLGTAGSWAGSNLVSATGSVNIIATNSATFYITGVQLEAGTTATPFEQRLYGTELALCQRYFISYGGQANYERFGTCLCSGPTTGIVQMPFPIEMRAVPTLTYPSASYIGVYTGSAVVTLSAIGGDSPSSKVGMFNISTTGLTSGATYQCLAQNTSLARLNWSAEL